MDVGNIPAVASALAAKETSDSVNIAMLKKALDTQATAAVGILQALPLPANPNIGRNVNTVA
ncbi:hypothetical protein F506_15835 [Herbaspirillum hiltneri N3]|uniref:Motility protein YjfB-like n=1 Tax=Herbaspirillum hiltneri N3 TaxID=1262470 RepID=A0ABM5V326_9BURK|nr:YjfB family protein [Herbaspirillum hiltneri]AKZ63936.1 hypothetical protein F506_15835 [Herbaspirillum hiltneri N3]